MSQKHRELLLIVLVCTAAAEFVVRGPLRLARHSDFNDFISPYVQSRDWLQGMNPYDPQTLLRFWPVRNPETDFVAKEAADGTLVVRHGLPSPYPPPTFVILAPFALLPWPVALLTWSGLTVAAFALAVFCLASLGGLHRGSASRLCFVALALAFAPVHSGLATGNPSILTLALGIVAIWLVQDGREAWGGILTGVALCLKPPVGLGFLLFLVVSRRWRAALAAVVCNTTVAVVAVVRMAWVHVEWFASYLELSRKMFSTQGVNDPTAANAIRFSMVNLQVLLSSLGGERWIANAAALLITAVLGILWLHFAVRRHRATSLLSLALLLTLLLLPTYHRSYEAAALLVSSGWILAAWHGQHRALARVAFSLTLLFLLPGPVLLQNFVDTGLISRSMSQSWWWNTIAMPHQIWALCLLSLVMLYAMASTEEQLAGDSQERGIPSVQRRLDASCVSS